MPIFYRFDSENDVVSNFKTTVSSGIFSGGVGSLTSFFTSSVQSGSTGAYYYDVYKTDPSSDSEAEIQFSLAYGHKEGSGSLGTKGAVGSRASATIYRQMRNLLLAPNDDQFTMAGSFDTDDIAVVSFNRARMREKVDPGNWELHLQGTSKIKLIDDSSAQAASFGNGGRVFNVVSGSIDGGTTVIKTAAASETRGGIGLFYPDLGIIILRPSALKTKAGISFSTGSNTMGNNSGVVFDSLTSGAYFQARREENISSTHYFVRAGNKQFNFSTNPTFFTASDGSFVQPTYFKDPKTFITTVGLYNDNNELLAVAKLSKPLLKTFSREAIIKVKLDF